MKFQNIESKNNLKILNFINKTLKYFLMKKSLLFKCYLNYEIKKR